MTITRHQCALCLTATSRPRLCTACQADVDRVTYRQALAEDLLGLAALLGIATLAVLAVALLG